MVACFLCITTQAHAATNVYYSVGQSTSTNLETGSPTITLASGFGVFSIAQTGNIGVGDKVTYGSGSIAYISAKTNSNDLDWTLVSATGTIPANVSGVSVTSINRAYASLEGAVTGFTDSNHLATSSLVGANTIVNLPCYYDTGPDSSSAVSIPSSITTELATLQAEANQPASSPNSSSTSSYTFTRNLSLYDTGVDVKELQAFLIQEDSGPASRKLKIHGTTQTFGLLTYNALVEFQKKEGIKPASGYFGPVTRTWVNVHQ